MRSAQKIAIAALHQFGALCNEASRAITQKLTMSVPFFSNFFLSKDRNCDLSVRLALEALIERDKSMLKAFVARKRRSLNRSKIDVSEALQTLQEFGLS